MINENRYLIHHNDHDNHYDDDDRDMFWSFGAISWKHHFFLLLPFILILKAVRKIQSLTFYPAPLCILLMGVKILYKSVCQKNLNEKQ